MIVFDLSCDSGHRFEGWFGSSADFASQCDRALVSCPECGSVAIAKAPMAPAVPRKGNQLPVARAVEAKADRAGDGQQTAPSMPPGKAAELARTMARLAGAQAKALEQSRWVGERFASQSRAMHYGEAEAEPIHGRATIAEARDLLAEGIPVAPLPFPVAPPEELN